MTYFPGGNNFPGPLPISPSITIPYKDQHGTTGQPKNPSEGEGNGKDSSEGKEMTSALPDVLFAHVPV